MKALMFLVLLAVYAGYEELNIFAMKEESVAGNLVLGYVFFIIYLCMLLGISIKIHLWNVGKSNFSARLFIEKVFFIYILLLWRHKYDPSSVLSDGVIAVLSFFLVLIWLLSSSSIADTIVSFATRTFGESASELIPGRTVKQRLTNSTVLIVLIVVLPMCFWGVDYIFEKQ